MPVQNIIPVLPSSDLARDVALWSSLLGVAPTFIDGDRWAQFDLGPRRLALSGSDRISDLAGVMLKVDDLDATRATAERAGLSVSAIQQGPHERRCVAVGSDGAPIILYAAL